MGDAKEKAGARPVGELRIAVVMELAPRKLGSFEDWIVALAREATWRGHRLDLYTRLPIHPQVAAWLEALQVRHLPLQQLEAAGLRGARRILSQYDVVHLNFVAPRSRVALAAYAAWPARVLFVVHSDHAAGPAHGALARLARRAVDRATLLRVDGLAGVSDYVRRKEAARFGVPDERTRVIFNGVDLARFNVPPRPCSEPGQPVELLAVSWLVPDKGVHLLLKALARLPRGSARLRVAGDGPQLQALSRLTDELGLSPHVRFLGLHNDVPALVAGADVCIQPSLREAFGLTIAEAMAAGRAVLAAPVGGVSELVSHQRTGLLADPRDTAAFAQALRDLVERPELRAQLGQAARREVRSRFDLRVCVQGHLDWCEETARAHQGVVRPVRDVMPARVPTFARPTTADAPLGAWQEPPASSRRPGPSA